MKKSEIKINIDLDERHVPEKISWQASDQQDSGLQEAKAFAFSVWDAREHGTLKIDLWNKEMDVLEMKRFIIETMSGLADTVRRATSDSLMAMDIENLCRQLQERVEKEVNTQQRPGKPQ